MTQQRSQRSQHHEDTAAAGFSLLEVLVALALLTLIMIAMPGTLQLGRRAWDSSDTIDRAGSAAIAVGFVQNRISRSMPLQQKRADDSRHVAFDGRPNAITFVAPSIDGPPGAGLFIFELATSAGTGAQDILLLRWWPYQPAFEDSRPAPVGERILLRDVTGFSLRYFGRAAAGVGRGWAERWQRASLLPELVEFRLTSRTDLVADPPAITIELLAQNVPRYD